ncbi:MAG: n-acetylglutamate synthase [Deltaproteobacteria bacterium]|nr:n-acetylglutamate synthase [Deltaproteobacteria bacterium]
MNRINYHNKRFRAVSNSEKGEVDGETVFHYTQEGDMVSGTYRGGSIRFGTLIARIDDKGELHMRYQHMNQSGELMTGKCRSVPEVLPHGRLRLKEQWQWTCGDFSKGESLIEEIQSE